MSAFNNKSQESTPKADAGLSSAPNKNLRRSERVFVTLRIRVSAPSERGEEFLGEGHTVDVSHDGAAIAVDRDLSIGQVVKIRRVGVDKEAPARVVGHYKDSGPGTRVYGIVLDDNKSNLWDIVFPAGADLEKAVLRALLRCVACGRLEVCYLNEFESDLFLNHHSVARLCTQCNGWTTWTRPYGIVGPDSGGAEKPEVPDPGPRNATPRSRERLHSETVGCIRHPAFGNEVVLVSALASDGLSFLSVNQYPEGAYVEMAIPYTSKAPNIFSLVRIVGARKPKDGNLTEYRATYFV